MRGFIVFIRIHINLDVGQNKKALDILARNEIFFLRVNTR